MFTLRIARPSPAILYLQRLKQVRQQSLQSRHASSASHIVPLTTATRRRHHGHATSSSKHFYFRSETDVVFGRQAVFQSGDDVAPMCITVRYSVSIHCVQYCSVGSVKKTTCRRRKVTSLLYFTQEIMYLSAFDNHQVTVKWFASR